MTQMRNEITYMIMLSLIFWSCDNQKEYNDTDLSTAQKEYIKKEMSKIDENKYIDSTSTTKEMLELITPAATNQLYDFVNSIYDKSLLLNICAEIEGNMVVVNITVKDTLIVGGSCKIYEFDSKGNLASYSDGGEKLVSLFDQVDAREFDFIDNYTQSYYDFRFDVNKLCKKIGN